MSCVWVLQRGHSGDGCVLASTLCKYDLKKGDLFVLSWARVRRVRRGSIFSELLVCNVVSLYVVCCSVNVSVCFVCCVLDSVCELFGETIRNVCGCSCYFVVECYGCVKCVWWCSVG